MITLQIINDTPEAKKFLEFARTLPFIREKVVKAKPVECIPPCQYATEEEFRSAVFKGMDDIRAGRIISQKDLEKEVNSW